MADGKIIIGVGTEGVQKTNTELNSVKDTGEKVVATNEKLAKSNDKLNTSYRGTGGQVRNASYQLQDFFTQIQGGTSITTALSQQLPQLLSGFGLLGVVAGTAAAGIGLIATAFDLFSSKSQKIANIQKATNSTLQETSNLISLFVDSTKLLTETSANAFQDWVKKFKDASGEVKTAMIEQIELFALLNEQSLIEARRKLEIAREKNIAKTPSRFGEMPTEESPYQYRGGIDQKRVDAEQRALELKIKQLEDFGKRLDALKNKDTATATAGSDAQKALTITIEQRIEALQAEAKYYGVSNAEKEKGIKLAELEAQAKRDGVAFSETDAKVQELIIAIYQKHNQEQKTKIEQYERDIALQAELSTAETSRLTMTTREYEKLVEQIKLEAFIKEKSVGWEKENVIALGDVLRAKLKVKQATDDLNEANRKSFGAGASSALKKYKEDLQDVAKSAETLFTNVFKGIEDAMVTAFTTGKLSFKSMIDAMMADIARLVIRQTIMRPLFGGMDMGGGGGTSGAGLASLGSSLADTAMKTWSLISGGGIAMATGTNNVPYDGFQATLHKGEAVVPAKYNPAVGGAGGQQITYSPIINIDSRTDQSQVRQLVSSAVQQGQVDLVERINRGKVRIKT